MGVQGSGAFVLGCRAGSTCLVRNEGMEKAMATKTLNQNPKP